MTILAKDFRKIARDSLGGRWGMAVGAGFVASLLGASTAITAGGGLNYSSTNSDVSTADYEAAQAQAQKIVDFLNSDQFVQNILPWLLGMGVVLLIWLLVNLIVGGAVTLGYAQFNLNLVDDRDPHFSDIFSHIHRLWEGFLHAVLPGNDGISVVTVICHSGNHCQLPVFHDAVYSGGKYGTVCDGSHYGIQENDERQ